MAKKKNRQGKDRSGIFAEELGLTGILNNIKYIPEIDELTSIPRKLNYQNISENDNKSGFALVSSEDLKKFGINERKGQVSIYIQSPKDKNQGMVYFAVPKEDFDADEVYLSLKSLEAGENLETALRQDIEVIDRLDYLSNFANFKETGLQRVFGYNAELPFINCETPKNGLVTAQVITPNYENLGLGLKIYTQNPNSVIKEMKEYTPDNNQKIKKLYKEVS